MVLKANIQSSAWFALVLFSLGVNWGCKDTSPGTSKSTPSMASQANKSKTVEEAILVQVLIQGAAVFDFNESPARVLFPKMRHKVKIWQGVVDPETDAAGWFPPEGIDASADGADDPAVTILFKGSIEPNLIGILGAASVEGFPKNSQDARKIGWVLPSRSSGPHERINALAASSIFPLTPGNLETCGLVHRPKEFNTICKVQFGSTYRAATEYAVLRFRVDTEDSLSISILRGDTSTPVSIKPPNTGNPVINIDGVDYPRVLDFRIGNMSMDIGPPRSVTSSHGDTLKPLFIPPDGDWGLRVPHCEDAKDGWNCAPDKCKTNLQPPCLAHFEKYEDIAMGGNRPICPFVQDP